MIPKDLYPDDFIRFPFWSIQDQKSWFQNLLTYSRQDVGTAFRWQHEFTALMVVGLQGLDLLHPETIHPRSRACYSHRHSHDTLDIKQSRITGCKHWISGLDQADWAVFQYDQGQYRQYVFMKKDKDWGISLENVQSLGLEGARAWTLTLDHDIEPWQIFGNVDAQSHFPAHSFASRCGLTNYLGSALACLDDIYKYSTCSEQQIRSAEHQVSVLYLLWQKEIDKIDHLQPTDSFWPEFNTSYVQAKNTLQMLVNLMLNSGNGLITSLSEQPSKSFRDALTLITHGQNINQNLCSQTFMQKWLSCPVVA